MRVIIVILEISVAHNLELKARAQCVHRKTKKKKNYIKNKNKKTNKAHTMDNHTINEEKKEETTTGKVDSPETTNCTSVHKHVIK